MVTKDFGELLKGCVPFKDKHGNIVVQSILNMQVVCLTTSPEYSLDERFANPLVALRAENHSYGQITFINDNSKEVIIPNQIAVMTKQSAQNHGMIKAGYVNKKQSVTFHDAGCVQGGQTGYFNNTQEFRMIPISMREMLFESVGESGGYDRIYPAINKLGVETSSNAGNYLNVYFERYDKDLEQFIAHFERPNNLIGIIVFVDGEIIGIDKFPSFTYAEILWDMMIRDCYGSLAIISELKHKSKNNIFSKTFEKVKTGFNGDSIDLLEKVLNKAKKDITNDIENKIREILDISFNCSLDYDGNPSSNMSTPKSYILESDGYIGQVIIENDFNHLVSVVKREAYNPNAYRDVNSLKAKARKQNRFTL